MVEGRNNRVPIKDTSRPGRWLTVSQGGESSYDEHTVTGGGGVAARLLWQENLQGMHRDQTGGSSDPETARVNLRNTLWLC